MVQFARQVSTANYHIVSCGARLALLSLSLSSRSPLIDVPAAAQLREVVNFLRCECDCELHLRRAREGEIYEEIDVTGTIERERIQLSTSLCVL